MKHRSTNAARFALTAVALATACLWTAPASALGLGRLNVQSALGETLRAEVEVTSITPDELASIKMRVASPEAYRQAGIDYNAALATAEVKLEKRNDGRQVLRITSDRAVLEPFVDVILEADWATGRLVREYTMLFDPPGHRLAQQQQAPATAQTSPVISPAPAPAQMTTPAPAPMAQAPARPAPRPIASNGPRSAAEPAPRPAAMEAAADQVRVRAGDSLSRIASRVQRPGVSLDQMLVALYRGNPQAFMGENMNRLKSGVVLTVPAADSATKTSDADAHSIIVAQSADFASYRQRLAAGTTTVATAAPTRQAQGKVEASVEDRKQAANPTPDKLTLSQGNVKGGQAEAKVSKAAERKESDARLAELARNVDELKKLQGAAAASAAATVAQAEPKTMPMPASAPAPALQPPVALAPPPAPTPPPPPPVAASKPEPKMAASAPVHAPPPPADEPGFLSSLLDNPLVVPGAVVLVALLAGLGMYRLRGRVRKQGGETSFLESRLQPDSFFGASGGQRIDTREGGGSSSMSSMSYSLSQLDAIGDVDPVAEADVYLAYGRDLQAEEILKEAMRSNPERMAVRIKLLEVYVKRRDLKGFELLATQVYTLTRGTGEDWEKAQELGRQLDPENPLYRSGGKPELQMGPGGTPIEPLGAETMPHTAKQTAPPFVPASDATLGGGLDLDLDLDLGSSRTGTPLPPAERTQPIPPQPMPLEEPMTMPNAMRTVAMPKPAPTPPAPAPTPAPARDSQMGALDFDLGDLSLDAPAAPAAPAPARAPAAAADSSLDFGEFKIEGHDTEAPTPSTLDDDDADPLARKLELAEEFRQIGDMEGARDLLEEVVAKAEGTLKSKAQGMLNGLG